KEVMAAALIENLQREDLNPIEEALALQGLREALELTQEELAARLGKSRPAIANALRLLQLSPAAQEDLRAGRLSAGHARCLLGVNAVEATEALRLRIISHTLTVRDAEEAAAFWRENKIFPWEPESRQADAEAQKEPPARTTRKKSPQIRNLQQNLSKALECKALVSGNEQTGKITLAYGSAEELQSLLARLGVALPEA
ncbi:MAG: ParB/RepB/Spo0J family partition protein, partial [Desulfovibrio fairfieldensis]